MLDCFRRVIQCHPRACIAHDDANLLPHLGLITINRTLPACGLVFAKLAMVQPGGAIDRQCLTVCAQDLSSVMMAAIKRNHLADSTLFRFDAAMTHPVFSCHKVTFSFGAIPSSYKHLFEDGSPKKKPSSSLETSGEDGGSFLSNQKRMKPEGEIPLPIQISKGIAEQGLFPGFIQI